MIELKLELENIDFDALVDRYLPLLTEQLRASGNPVGMLLSNGMSGSMAKAILRGLSKESKEQLAADLINASKSKLISSLQELSEKQGVSLQVRDLQAKQNHS